MFNFSFLCRSNARLLFIAKGKACSTRLRVLRWSPPCRLHKHVKTWTRTTVDILHGLGVLTQNIITLLVVSAVHSAETIPHTSFLDLRQTLTKCILGPWVMSTTLIRFWRKLASYQPQNHFDDYKAVFLATPESLKVVRCGFPALLG